MNFLNKLTNCAIGVMLLLSSPGAFSQSQQTEVIQYKNAKGQIVPARKAKSLTRVRVVSDTCWQFDLYGLKSPLLTSIEYKEVEGRTRHGRAAFMRQDGTLDSTGNFVNNVQHGTWLYFNNKGVLTTKKEYSMGALVFITSIGDKKAGFKFDKEAEFPGGATGWLKHLTENLVYPTYAMENSLKGTVTAFFLVDAEGNIRDPIILKSVGFSLDDETIRMFRLSPKWIPASRDGQPVQSYKAQPITFSLEKG